MKKEVQFYVRFFSGVIDLLLFFSFSLLLIFVSFFVFNSNFQISYYFWLLSQILFLIIYFNVLPIVYKGQTIGKIIFKYQIILNINNQINKKNNMLVNIIKRNLFFSVTWIIMLLISIILIQPDTLKKIIDIRNLSNLKNINLSNEFSNLEKIFFNLFLAFSNINFLVLFVIFILNISKKNPIDFFSGTRAYYLHKKEEITKKQEIEIEVLNWQEVEWEKESEHYVEWN